METNRKIVGEISYDRRDRIGTGFFGVVFRGLFHNSLPVAVKRKQIMYDSDRADQQLELFRVTRHPNILQFFGVEKDLDFMYVKK